MSSVSRAVRAAPHAVHPVVDHELLVDDAAEQLGAPRVDADDAPRRHGRTIYRVCEPTAPPEYKVYRSRRNPLVGPAAARATSTRLRERLARSATASRASPASAPDHPGRVVKWIALAVVGWLLLSLVAVHGQRPAPGGRVRAGRARAVERGQPAHRQHDPRARLRRAHRRLDRRVAERAPPAPTRSCSCTPRFGGVRKLSIPRDSFAEIPGHGAAEDQRRLRARRAGAHDRDGRVLPGQRRARSTT